MELFGTIFFFYFSYFCPGCINLDEKKFLGRKLVEIVFLKLEKLKLTGNRKTKCRYQIVD